MCVRIGQIRRHIGDANEFGRKQLTEFYVVLAVILINDTYYVANLYQLFFMPKCIISEYITQTIMYHLRYEIVYSVTKL